MPRRKQPWALSARPVVRWSRTPGVEMVVARGERVFLIGGSGHAVLLEPALSAVGRAQQRPG